MSSRSDLLRQTLARRVLVADGAMGTMLQAADPSDDDFQGLEGCNEILNVTRPDIVAGVHDAYLAVGVDLIETNTFGANFGNLGEYGIAERAGELAQAGAAIARQAADRWSSPEHPRFVIGSMGPGTKLPSLGHAPYAQLRDVYQQCAAGLALGGADLLLVETCQDLLQAKAAVVGARRALRELGEDLPVIVSVTVETTGTMLLGSQIDAALAALEPLGIDGIGLNCATGPAEMGEHLRYLARHARIPLTCMPNAGLPQLTADGARYPLAPGELAAAHTRFVDEFGLQLVGGCCGTTPEHLRAVVEAVGHHEVVPRRPVSEPAVASLYSAVPLRQDTSYLSVGERTNANGSKAFREAMVAGDWEQCVDIARNQTRDGAHLLDVCVDYVGRDGVQDVQALVGRLATSSTLPLVLDSTEPAVLEAGLEMLGGRAVVNSVNFEDGEGPSSRFARTMALVREHGAAVVALTIDETGQARTRQHKLAVAERLITTLTGEHGMRTGDIIVDCLTFPIATGTEETRGDAIETIEAIRELKRRHPDVQTTLGVSNVSFGLSPAARVVLNSVFLHECLQAGLDSAIVHTARIVPTNRIPQEQRDVALDLVYDRRRPGYDPLERFLELFDGVDTASVRAARADELAGLPLAERLERRIVDGERAGLEADLDEALAQGQDPLEIVNSRLLAGMRTVGELFGRGEMQLPFVLQSAEVMKAAVAHLTPAIEASMAAGTEPSTKAKIVLATVKGDVHDIGKNLVDIILSNNGYDVVNLGIKQPISEIIRAAQEHEADAIGMSGLLVKSTVVMKENLEELNDRQLADRFPVILGGAALTRAFVEEDLAGMYAGHVRYARDAFEGLRLMEAIAAARNGEVELTQALPALRQRRVPAGAGPVRTDPADLPARSDVAADNDIPVPPFWGPRQVRGIALADYAGYLDERATFLGQWGLKPSRGDGPSYSELVESQGRPRLRAWLDRMAVEGLARAAVAYGYYPCYSQGDDIVIVWHTTGPQGQPEGSPRARLSFPRQHRDRHLCLADFIASKQRCEQAGRFDVLPLQLVTMGEELSRATARLFDQDAYRDYLELHGLSVQLTEALAEYWHARVREELGFPDRPDLTVAEVIDQAYRGARYSFGYPACPELADRAVLVDLVEADRIGVVLSEELQLHPEQSTDALVMHHPEAVYFNAG